MGTGGGVAVAQSKVRYCFVTFPFTFKDRTLVQLIQKSRIVGLTLERKPRRQQASCTEGNTQVESIYDRYTCFIYLHVTCPWIGQVK